jgi:hypothetical protein
MNPSPAETHTRFPISALCFPDFCFAPQIRPNPTKSDHTNHESHPERQSWTSLPAWQYVMEHMGAAAPG